MTFIEWWHKLGIFHGRDTVSGLIEPMEFAALTWEAAQPEWQPIETAPHGKAVLVFYKNNLGKSRIVKAQYIERYTEEYTPEGWYEIVDNWYEYSSYRLETGNNPTHWMPIPQPPKEQ